MRSLELFHPCHISQEDVSCHLWEAGLGLYNWVPEVNPSVAVFMQALKTYRYTDRTTLPDSGTPYLNQRRKLKRNERSYSHLVTLLDACRPTCMSVC